MMNTFLKISAGLLVALIIWISLNRQGKDISVLLSVAVCVMVATSAMGFLEPIINFLKKIQGLGNLDADLLSVIFKVVGIGLLTEITVLVCKDAGNEAMGKSLQILSTVTALWLSIPVLEKLLSLLDKILGAV